MATYFHIIIGAVGAVAGGVVAHAVAVEEAAVTVFRALLSRQHVPELRLGVQHIAVQHDESLRVVGAETKILNGWVQ